MSYVTVIGKDGIPYEDRSVLDHKIIYIFTDRIAFYSSSLPDSSSLEREKDLKAQEIEAKIERVIHFGDIILDCGKNHNKLCHAQDYPGIKKLKSFKDKIETKINDNPAILCIVIPFFENGYKLVHEKIAYICGEKFADVKNIIQFKNELSRNIELYQLKMSADRFNGFNGLQKRNGKFITLIDGKMTPVLVKVFNTGLHIISNDKEKKYLKSYSFYELRMHKFGAFIASEGLKDGRTPQDWTLGMSPIPIPECCIYFKGDKTNLTICLASKNGNALEMAIDICKAKMKSYYSDIKISLRGIKFIESYHELAHNVKKLVNCKSYEYILLKKRAEMAIDFSIGIDCRYLLTYSSGQTYESIIAQCKKGYTDELALEHHLMSLGNSQVFEGIENCIYHSEEFKKVFGENFFNEKLKKYALDQKIDKSSFLQLNSYESDGDEEDADNVLITTPKKESPVINFTEINSQRKNNGYKNKKTSTNDIIYSKPKPNFTPIETQRLSAYRNAKIKQLQSRHTWKTSTKENIDESFNKDAASLGTSNSDEFVSFLGFLRDASSRASKKIFQLEEKKFMNKN